MNTSYFKSLSLAAAAAFFATGVAFAGMDVEFSDHVDSSPQAVSRVQPITGAAPGSVMERPELGPLQASKQQMVSREDASNYDLSDRISSVPWKVTVTN